MQAVTIGGPGLVAVGAGPLGAAVWTSPDGVRWNRVRDVRSFHDAVMYSVASGPAGLVAVGYDDATGAAAWFSTDGVTWSKDPPIPANDMDYASMQDITTWGSSYIAVGSPSAANPTQAIWFSTDGRRWTPAEIDLPLPVDPESPPIEVTAVAGGSNRLIALAGGEIGVLTSTDGQHWSPIPDRGPLAFGPELNDVAATPGGGFVIVGAVGEEAAPAAWTSPDGLQWTSAPTSAAFDPGDHASYRMASIAVDAEGLVVVGGSPHGDAVSVWTSVDGVAWRRSDQAAVEPEAIGRFEPAGVTPWHDGFLAVGSFPNLDPLGGRSAAVWESPLPVAPTMPPPGPVACAKVGTNLRSILAIVPADRARCFGPRTIAFRAWTVEVDCSDACNRTPFPPAMRIIGGPFFAPVKGQNVYWLQVLLDQRLPRIRVPTPGRLVRVTGHFADPRASRCAAASVDGCRAAFIVTGISQIR